jgi:hypothetical protein
MPLDVGYVTRLMINEGYVGYKYSRDDETSKAMSHSQECPTVSQDAQPG